MNNKEKCRELKSIRKQMADNLGVELNQTECTYEGECSGTCPKCQKEEKTLNRVLLSGAVAATIIALSGCTPDLSGDVPMEVSPTPTVVVEPLGGDVSAPETTDICTTDKNPTDAPIDIGTDELVGIVPMDITPEIEALEGDVEAPVEEFEYNVEGRIPEDDILDACCKYKNAIASGIEYYNGNMADVSFCSVGTDENGNLSSTIVDIISVDIFSGDATTSKGEEFNIWDYIEKN